MSALIIADAHLPAHDPAPARFLCHQLQNRSEGLTHLVLLGDMFDFVTGDPKTHGVAVEMLLTAMASLRAQGCHVIWVEGNHDFCLAPQLSEHYQIDVIADQQDLTIDSLRVHLTHGDLITSDDPGYRLLRRFLRSLLLKTLIRILPATVTRRISDCANRRSERRHRQRPKAIAQPLQQQLIRYARTQWQRGVDLVLCGHFHQNWQANEGAQQIRVVGAWAQQPQALYYDGQRWEHQIYSPDDAAST